MAQMVKSLPPMQKTQIRSHGQEEPLKKEMETHSNNSCLEDSMDRGAWWAIVHGFAESDMTEQVTCHFSASQLTPCLKYSILMFWAFQVAQW